MVSIYSEKVSLNDTNERIVELRGLSTDTKPTTGIGNGSVYIEIDTQKIFFYDGTSETWKEV